MRITNPITKLIRGLWFSIWFAALGLFPLFYGPHGELPAWQHIIDRTVHTLGMFSAIVCLGIIAYAFYVSHSLGVSLNDIKEWELYKEDS